MSDYPMLISNKLHSFRNFTLQIYYFSGKSHEERAAGCIPAALFPDECAGWDYPISTSTASVATFSPGCTSTCFTVPA